MRDSCSLFAAFVAFMGHWGGKVGKGCDIYSVCSAYGALELDVCGVYSFFSFRLEGCGVYSFCSVYGCWG